MLIKFSIPGGEHNVFDKKAAKNLVGKNIHIHTDHGSRQVEILQSDILADGFALEITVDIPAYLVPELKE